MQVRSDGKVRTVEKTHDLKYEDIEWLLESKPEILIIGTGWQGIVKPEEKIKKVGSCKIHIMKTGEAVNLFNKLKSEGKKVSIHLHSTC